MKPKPQTTKPLFRQGDVCLERIAHLPPGLSKQKPIEGRIILARGEVTGHHHSLDIDAADWWKSDTGEQFVTVTERTPVEHQEHKPISLAKGVYKIIQQQEYTPQNVRSVAD